MAEGEGVAAAGDEVGVDGKYLIDGLTVGGWDGVIVCRTMPLSATNWITPPHSSSPKQPSWREKTWQG